MIPFVTEELWSYLGYQQLLAGSSYPRADSSLIDERSEREVQRVIEAIQLVRGWRDSVSARPGLIVSARLQADGYESTCEALARLARLELEPGAGNGGGSIASVPVPGGSVEILSEEGLDLAAAAERRANARRRLEQDIARASAKLSKPGFAERAPAEIVAGERAKLARLETELEAL